MGGKRSLAPVILAEMGDVARYVEPFVGAGAVALARSGAMWINDVDGPLVALWRAVASRPEAFFERVTARAAGPWDAIRFEGLRVREAFDRDPADLWLCLNLCYNGLYRRGQFGRFNAPWSGREAVTVPELEAWTAAAAALTDARITHGPALDVLAECGAGDGVYLDPPYVGVQAYSGGGRWGWRDLDELVGAAESAAARGARVVLSHHADPEVLAMLRRWRIVEVEAARPVNRDGAGRGKVAEIVAVLG
jgi:DNA adenine methylase